MEQKALKVFEKLTQRIDLKDPDTQIKQAKEEVYAIIFDSLFEDKEIVFAHPPLNESGKVTKLLNPSILAFLAKTEPSGNNPLPSDLLVFYGNDFYFKATPHPVGVDMKKFKEISEQKPYYAEVYTVVKKALDNNPKMEMELLFYANGNMPKTGVIPAGKEGFEVDIPFEVLTDPKTGTPLKEEELTCSFLDMKHFAEIERLVMTKVMSEMENSNLESKNIREHAESLIYTDEGKVAETPFCLLLQEGKCIEELETDLFFILDNQNQKIDEYIASKSVRLEYDNAPEKLIEHLAQVSTSMLLSEYDNLTLEDLCLDNLYDLSEEQIVAIKEDFAWVISKIIAQKIPNKTISISSGVDMETQGENALHGGKRGAKR